MEEISHVFRLMPDGSVATNKLVLTVAEAGRALGYGYGTMRNKLQANPSDPLGCGLSPVRIGKSPRFLVRDVIHAVAAAEEAREADKKLRARPAAPGKARRAKKRQ